MGIALALKPSCGLRVDDNIWQAFAVICQSAIVRVMGDFRTLDYVVGLCAVTSTDAVKE
jgi:GMP synthase (glutamine-hydrolysing)